ncbi:hypothetical protein COO60DRAFT_1545242 [Scenedesmus sp. NREL 46B-D3]|nr:hypothetical protein COO60DRAFT_1545242 [Scenedesmus sp. NREL 46B-D3]
MLASSVATHLLVCLEALLLCTFTDVPECIVAVLVHCCHNLQQARIAGLAATGCIESHWNALRPCIQAHKRLLPLVSCSSGSR